MAQEQGLAQGLFQELERDVREELHHLPNCLQLHVLKKREKARGERWPGEW